MRNIKWLLAGCCLCVLSACGGGGGSSPGSGSIGNPVVTSVVSGTIADKLGNRISGVTVSVFHHNNNSTTTTTTDTNGAYSVAGLSTGNNSEYEIYAGKVGFGFYPSITDPAGDVGKLDFYGLYRTTLQFMTMPTHNVSGANFIASQPGDKTASLPRTGQTVSYTSGDDYSARQGVTWPGTRYTDNTDGTITDHLTGLIWLKDARCYSATDWSTALAAANLLASGTCGLTDASTAGQWRMPNINELESLVDVSQNSPALSNGYFTNIDTTHAYWSSTTYMALNTSAMAIRFTDGRWINGAVSGNGSFNNDKTTSANSLWAVKSDTSPGAVQILATGVYPGVGGGSFGARDDASLQLGAPLTSPRFIDNADGTLSDTVTGLVWLKQADCFNQTWSGAITAINSLASGQCGLTDASIAGQWRMPNRNEMLSLSDRAPTFPQASYLKGIYQSNSTVTGPVIFNNFMVSNYYWTSTTDAADTTQAWTVYSCDFGVYNNLKSSTTIYALAVR